MSLLPFTLRRLFRNSNRRGVTLVVVLGMLALMAVLMISYLTSASTELAAAKRYSSGLDARGLTDSAVNIVISQIQDATTTPSLAWASQPGMLRTYDDAGQAVMAYKLYSSDQLRVTGAFNPILSANSEVPSNWAQQTMLYTDLNRPVSVSGVKHYPIIYPSAVAVGPGSTTAVDGSGSPIEGCFIDTANAATTVNSTQKNPVPMPVQWMYVLKNGSVVGMDPATKRVSGAGATLPDGTPNVITGRIAFWTDDESSKVNVNTASEGTFWERPWTGSNNDYDLAQMMPAANEFQRFPGHPATTALSVVFPPIAGESVLDYKNRVYGMVPRIVSGGSNGGTTPVIKTTPVVTPDAQRLFASVDEFLFQGLSPAQAGSTTRAVQGTAIAQLTQSDIEKSRFFITTSSRAPEVNMWNKPRITIWPLQANTTKVEDPVNAPARSAMDKLIAFCSTIGTKPYYFQRYNTYTTPTQLPAPSSQSPLDDWNLVPRNQELYAYLQKLTAMPIPGLGGALGGPVLPAKYQLPVRDQILTEIFDYIRSGINTFSTNTTPKYYYTPFDPSNFITCQSQIVPLALPNGTKGFGRFPTIQQAAICFYRKDKLRAKGKITPEFELDGTSNVIPEPLADITITEGTPCDIGMAIILQPFNATPGAPPWSPNLRFCLENLDTLRINGNGGFPNKVVNLVTAIHSTINATAFTGMEEFTQQPPRKPKTIGMTMPDNPDETLYPFVSDSIKVSGSTMIFSGGDMVLKIYNGKKRALTDDDLVQTITFRFPPFTQPVPTVPYTQSYNATTKVTTITHENRFTDYYDRLNRQAIGGGRWGYAEDNSHQPLPLFRGANASSLSPAAVLLARGDIIRSVEARYGGDIKGDLRLIAGLKSVPEVFFEGHGERDPTTNLKYSDATALTRISHSVRIHFPGSSDTSNQVGFYVGAGGSTDKRGKLVKAAAYMDDNRGNNTRRSRTPVVPRGMVEALMADGKTLGDWDTGPGHQPDGPYINKGDEGNANMNAAAATGATGIYYQDGGYLTGANIVESGSSYSPNRQISSAVTFGSLPSGIDPRDNASTTSPKSKPWQTLLFCKNPAGGKDHPGFGITSDTNGYPPYNTPPDHAFLDLFTMPIVEPYAISEPFSTAGKVNLNYQIVPFTYLTRDTGMRAVLKAVNVMAIPFGDANGYKEPTLAAASYRYNLNVSELDGTLAGFQKRFATGDIFRSATEICDIYLVPGAQVDTGTVPAITPTYSTMETWWRDYTMTGDNLREAPYGHIYPRVTTKSNTFTVHVMTQSIKKGRNSPVDEFVDGQDTVMGEFRGSVLIQRFLDPNADYLVKADGRTPATELDTDAMVGPYKFRVLSTKQFAP